MVSDDIVPLNNVKTSAQRTTFRFGQLCSLQYWRTHQILFYVIFKKPSGKVFLPANVTHRHKNTHTLTLFVAFPRNLVAATLRWILSQLHSKTVLAHIGAFPNKCTIKHPFSHNSYMKNLEFYQNYITLFCLEKLIFWGIILTQNHALHITQSGRKNYLVYAAIKEQHHSVTCSV